MYIQYSGHFGQFISENITKFENVYQKWTKPSILIILLENPTVNICSLLIFSWYFSKKRLEIEILQMKIIDFDHFIRKPNSKYSVYFWECSFWHYMRISKRSKVMNLEINIVDFGHFIREPSTKYLFRFWKFISQICEEFENVLLEMD